MNDNEKYVEKFLTFSQRQGYESMPEQMHLEEISDDLRREIWNETRRLLLLMRSINSFGMPYFGDDAARMIERIIGKIKHQTEDDVNLEHDVVLTTIKNIIFVSSFNKVIDLVELIISESPKLMIEEDRFLLEINHIFKMHAAAYWLDTSALPPRFFPHSTKMQGEATKFAINTIRSGGMKGAETHLRKAANHIKAGQFADSIADSIHAVESVARMIDPKSKTLGEALSSLERSDFLKHPALKEAFIKLYGYTSDEQGIRHSLLDKPSPDVDLDEAMFMFGTCASFAAYLVNKHRKAAQRQGSGQ